MKKSILTLLAALGFAVSAQAQVITGAGATFPYPIYSKWAETYKATSGVSLNYQSIGSSGGIRQINANTVAFGATDAPVSGADLDQRGQVQFPAVLGGVVPIFNLEGFRPGELRVSGTVLAEIFMGRITKWNDPKIVALNPGRTMPNQNITVVHRADGSGTTFIFTDYLNEVSQDWRATVGKGASVKWPAASSVGGKGNEGVAANVERVKGAVGYVEYAYAKKNRIPHFKMENRNGLYVDPDDTTFAAAAANADWWSVPGMGISLVNQRGTSAWPITGASFIIMYREPKDKKASQDVLKFFDWSFKNGKKDALDLDYVPLPDSLTNQIRQRIWTQIKH